MVLICHGFPNMISALRFEWAWQNPEKSLRLKHIVPKTRQFNFQAKFNVLSEMIRIGPWNRLGLTIRWLRQEYRQEFSLNKLPPTHMPIVYGLIEIYEKSKSKKKQTSEYDPSIVEECQITKCFICCKNIEKETLIGCQMALILKCFKCNQISHTLCMSKCFLQNDNKQLVPIDGNCPKCNEYLIWGDLIKHKINIKRTITSDVSSQDEEEEEEDEDEDDFVEREDDDEED